MNSGSPPDPLVALGEAREDVSLEAFREFVRRGEAGEPVALVTVVGTDGSVPRSMGAAMAVREDGTIVGTVGGGDLEWRVIEQARVALADGRPRRLHYDFTGVAEQNLDQACQGTAEFFIQPFAGQPALLVFGAGHIGTALAPMAAAAGFQVTVLDDRPGYPDPAGFPDAVRLVGGPFRENIEALHFDASSTYLVIVTYGHARDEEVLAACLRRPWRYAGMIGSQAKVSRIFRNLGTDEEIIGLLSRVHAPIGLDLGGRSPGEIAISILAELLAVRYGRDEVRPMSKTRVVPLPEQG